MIVNNTYIFVDKSIPVVHESFRRLGITENEDGFEEWEVLSDSDQWTICWTWRFTQFRYFKTLSKQHRSNHLPGTYSMLMKSALHNTMNEMKEKHGEKEFGQLMAAQYVLPQEAERFKEAYYSLAKKPPVNEERAAIDPLYRKRWLIKAQSHRGINFFSGMHQLKEIMHNNSMVAEYIEPLLVGGYKFDFAIYVAVTSIDPLRIYVFGMPKVRFCKFPYPDILDETSRELSYVVTQIFLPPWQIPALKPYYEKMGGYPSNFDPGANDMDVLKKWMDDNELDGDKFENEMISNIIKIVTGNRHKFTDGLKWLQNRWKNFHASPSNFFEMWRFDFIVDDEGKLFVVEVNQSPNMIVYNFTSDGTTDRILKREVIHNLLDMVTAGSAPLPDLPEMDEDYCDKNCRLADDDDQEDGKESSLWNMACWNCEDWGYNEHQLEVLHRAAIEYENRGRYYLAYPEITPLGHDPPFNTFLEEESDDDELLRKYIGSLKSRGLTETGAAAPMICYDRVQCFNQGECVDGQCICDEGYGGTVCNRLPKFTSKTNNQPRPKRKSPSSFLPTTKLGSISQDTILHVCVLVSVISLLLAVIARNRRIRRKILGRRKSDDHMV